jgi:hypothetical protein
VSLFGISDCQQTEEGRTSPPFDHARQCSKTDNIRSLIGALVNANPILLRPLAWAHIRRCRSHSPRIHPELISAPIRTTPLVKKPHRPIFLSGSTSAKTVSNAFSSRAGLLSSMNGPSNLAEMCYPRKVSRRRVSLDFASHVVTTTNRLEGQMDSPDFRHELCCCRGSLYPFRPGPASDLVG